MGWRVLPDGRTVLTKLASKRVTAAYSFFFVSYCAYNLCLGALHWDQVNVVFRAWLMPATLALVCVPPEYLQIALWFLVALYACQLALLFWLLWKALKFVGEL
jgi:hypothetical protein